MDYLIVVNLLGEIIDLVGVLAIISGIVFSLYTFLTDVAGKTKSSTAYGILRQNLGRTIIIGLELLIAGDIIRSVAVPPNFTTIGVLAIIVLIRSFLSIQIAHESEWKFPWNHRNTAPENRPPHTWKIKE